MGSFIQHKTNISAFPSQLDKIYDAASSDDNNDKPRSLLLAQQQQQQDAQTFLDQEQARVTTEIEKGLVRIIHQVYPEKDDTSMSLRDLAQAMYHVQQQQQYHDTPPSWTDMQQQGEDQALAFQPPHTQPPPPPDQPTEPKDNNVVPQHWTVGRILATVVETDHETDASVVLNSAKSTASTKFFPSPDAYQKSPFGSIVDDDDDDDVVVQKEEEPDPYDGADPEIHDDDDDDLAHQEIMSACETLLLSPTTPKPPTLSTSQSSRRRQEPSSGQKRANAFAQLEQRFRQEIFLFPANDNSHVQAAVPPRPTQTDPFAEDQVEDDDDEEEEDEEEYDEEETLETYTPTVVNRDGSIRRNQPDKERPTLEPMDHVAEDDDSAAYCATLVQNITPRSMARRRVGPRPSHVEFEPHATASPDMSSVNLTMDQDLEEDTVTNLTMTHWEETGTGVLEPVKEASRDEDEDDISSQISTETPLLDRFRLDFDERVPGGIVVRPNPRHGRHRVKLAPLPNKRKILLAHKTPHLLSATTTSSSIDENAPLNLATTEQTFPPSVRSTRPLPSTGTRTPLKVSTQSPAAAHLPEEPTTKNRRATYQEISTRANKKESSRLHRSMQEDSGTTSQSTRQAVRHVDMHTDSTSTGKRAASSKRQPVSHSPKYLPYNTPKYSSPRAAAPHTPVSQTMRPARLHQSLNGMSTELRNDENFLRRSTMQSSRVSTASASNRPKEKQRSPQKQVQIQPITSEEYEASPRVVTMQVTLAQVHRAVLLLNQAWRTDRHLTSTLTENQIALIWGMEMPDRQRTKLLLSLCHWRRIEVITPGEGSPHKKLYQVVE